MIEVFNEAPLAFVAVAFAFALMIGSFLNVVIYRLPIMMQREWRDQCEELQEALPDDLPEGSFNLVAPRSRCPGCGKPIKAWQNIPVLSYLFLGGQCAKLCQRRRSHPRTSRMKASSRLSCGPTTWSRGSLATTRPSWRTATWSQVRSTSVGEALG